MRQQVTRSILILVQMKGLLTAPFVSSVHSLKSNLNCYDIPENNACNNIVLTTVKVIFVSMLMMPSCVMGSREIYIQKRH